MNFVEVSKVDELPAGTMKPFSVEGKEILVINYEGKHYAIGGKCTHMGGDLSKGRLEGKTVICPRHSSKFDVTPGSCITGPKIGFVRLRTKNATAYEVKVEGNSIRVNV